MSEQPSSSIPLLSSRFPLYHHPTLARLAGFGLALALVFVSVLPGIAAPDTGFLPAVGQEGVESNNSSLTYLWTPFNQSTGLLSNNVTAILAQKDVIWFSTDAGISRFDGTWTNFQSADKLPPGRVTVLTQLGPDHEIWIGGSLGHLSRGDPQPGPN
jgi:ligand-binding sensor domain-containing protein